ncbi:MAG TPA: 3-methyladenine DNA glycosylase [Mycobacteriales bacterium]|nr:3-methyladenine DNA glycosylase [Mycobacteriales bacterium]
MPAEFSLPRILAPHRRGTGDPAFRVTADGAIWRASYTPDGPAWVRLRKSGPDIDAGTGGPGAGWLLDSVPGMLGLRDDATGFEPAHPFLVEAARRVPDLRIGHTNRVFEALVPAVLEQKVVGVEARRAWRLLLHKYGEKTPVSGLVVPPPPSVWQRIPSWQWHRAGVEAVRARTIITAARIADRLEGQGSAETDRRLRALTGIGVWTSAEIRQRSHGDPDAVSVGDFHLARTVGWTLERRIVDDAEMLQILQPYAGHRFRATRLIELLGERPPPRGPKLPARDYRRI